MPQTAHTQTAPYTIGATQVEFIWRRFSEEKIALDVVRPQHLAWGFATQQLGQSVIAMLLQFSEVHAGWLMQMLGTGK